MFSLEADVNVPIPRNTGTKQKKLRKNSCLVGILKANFCQKEQDP
jgi:hypothetical protein